MQSNNVNLKTSVKNRAYQLALAIVKLGDSLNQKDLAVQVIYKQLLRSTTSIGANIIEAQAGTSRRDFTNFFSHALKSANETKFWLQLLVDAKKANQTTIVPLLKETNELANMLGASILTLRGKRQL